MTVTIHACTAPQQVASVAEIRNLKLAPAGASDAALDAMLTFARNHRMWLAPERNEMIILTYSAGTDRNFDILVTEEGFQRVCRLTGLWFPGRVRYEGSSFGRTCFASSWWRSSTAESRWQEGAEVAVRFDDHYTRDRLTSKPVRSWYAFPDRNLFTIAVSRSARMALGDQVAAYLTFSMYVDGMMDTAIEKYLAGELPWEQVQKARSEVLPFQQQLMNGNGKA